MDAAEAELEHFRQQWRAEVQAKTQPSSSTGPSSSAASSSQPSKGKAPLPHRPSHHARRKDRVSEHRDRTDHAERPEDPSEPAPYQYPDLGEKRAGRRLDEASPPAAALSSEPTSALEHYEQAVEKESQGSLGDSLSLYRKAFKLDERVHETYKAKHFPPSYFKSKAPRPKPQDATASTSSSQPATASDPQKDPSRELPPTLQSMINDFSNLTILGEEPPTEFSPPPPCPIATLPEEILVQILEDVAVQDVANLARLAQVCKRLAYLVATEERVWKRIALGQEYGFAAMHYSWACQVDGKPLGDDGQGGYLLGSGSDSDDEIDESAITSPNSITPLLVPSVYSSYHTLFRRRPRVRFNGCYISTVNYTRPGASSPTSITWNSPIHIVTYFRYLRFLRDGTCISLLTTSEPADVVPYLYVEHMHRNHHGLPSTPMKDAVLGRWRLTGPELPGIEDGEKEGTLEIETAGATPKYLYKMFLSVSSAGRSARNNKLAWQGYWSYNRLTDDWGQFTLKNDRPFYWSRVKSYGMSWKESGMKV